MKKRLSCVFLTLMLMFVNMAPAYAAEVSATKEFGEMLEMSDKEMAAFSADNNGSAVMAESGDSLDSALSPHDVSVHGAVYAMTVYPIAFVEGHSNYVYFSNVKRTFQFTSYYQNARASLTPSSTQKLLQDLRAALIRNGATYQLAGWRLEVTFLFEAPSPQSFEWSATGTNLPSSPTNTLSLKNHGTSLRATIPCGFGFPSGVDLNAERYNIEIGGLYTFITDRNTLSMNVSGMFSLNSNIANTGGYWAA